MPSDETPSNPLDQLVELLVYAPVGLVYEYQDVIPRLVKRGRSQVQLARLLGQMAVGQARNAGPTQTADAVAGAVGSAVGSNLEDVAGMACSLLARAITELGASIGLAPQQAGPTPPAPPSPSADTAPAPPTSDPGPAPGPEQSEAAQRPPGAEAEARPVAGSAEEPQPLPIAGYDDLTAREIIGLVGDLSPAQRLRVRHHEQANRGRKTILAKLDQLEAPGS